MKRAGETKRPYRIWDAVSKKHVVGRNYSIRENALNGAPILVKWAKPGSAYEVYNFQTGRLIAQYVRKPTSILFVRG